MRFRPILLALVIATVAATWHVERADACSCMRPGPPCEAFWSTDVVFSGLVSEVATVASKDPKEQWDRRRVRFTVEERLRGIEEPKAEVWTGMGGGDCGYAFTVGERYLVYAYRNKETGRLGTGICSRTRPVADAAEDLAYIHSLASAEPGGTISGVISLMRHSADPERRYDTTPMEGVRVDAEGRSTRRTAVTDVQGRFVLAGLPEGEYRVVARFASGLVPDEGRTVTVHDRGCAEIPLSTTPDGRVRGRVLDADGKPLASVRVDLVPVDAVGYAPGSGMAFTEDDGTFSFEQPPPGRYVLGVNVNDVPTLDRPFRPTYYPDAADKADAAVLVVDEGKALDGYELRMPAPLAERTIEGAVTWPDGRPVADASVMLTDSSLPEVGTQFSAMTDAEGRFSIKALRDRDYLVWAVVNLPNGEQRHAEPVEPKAPIRLVVSERDGSCEKCRAIRWPQRTSEP